LRRTSEVNIQRFECTVYFGYMGSKISRCGLASNFSWWWYQQRNYVFQIWWWSVQGYSVGWGSNFAIPHLTTLSHYRV